MDPATIFKIITNSTWIVTQLMSGQSVQFSQKNYVVQVSEAAAPGTILLLQAVSPHEEAAVLYKLASESASPLFRVDAQSGALQLLGPLDFEYQTQHNLTVIATSKDGRIGSNEAHVTVEVLDANDHSPVFAVQRHEAQITEEDNHNLPRPVFTVTATDGDKGEWGVLRYSISGDGTAASDNLPSSDHFPGMKISAAFSSIEYGPKRRGKTHRDRAGQHKPNTERRVATLFMENEGHYRSPPLLDPGGVAVNGANASIASNQIDLHSDKLTVNSDSSAINRTNIAGKVRFSTDNIPESGLHNSNRVVEGLSKTLHNTVPSEGNHNFSSLDPDLLSENEHFHYAHSSEKRKEAAFTIDPVTGTIKVMQPLDRDPPHGRATWRLVVTASDGELQADTEVVVNLKDINDNAPVFLTARVEATVIENSPSGTPVVTITAEDFDDKNEGSNSKLIYSLQKNAVDEETGLAIFTVNASTGSISTAMCCLDRERASHYSLTVAATDGGGLQGSCEVLVLVADENDVPPRWGRAEWTVEVTEGAPLDQVLATLTVKDPDTRNSLAYRVAPDSGRGWQMVKIEGRIAGDGAELRSLVPLDYENPDLKDGLRFQVQVTDQGTDAWENKYRVGEATVIVRILDVNDNAPSFENVQQSVRVSEDAPLGTVVAKVPAFDVDENRNGLVRYSLAGRRGSSTYFGIDHTGTIRTIGIVDREAISKHSLVVHATDHGVPPRQSSATVT
ncbi:putative neural-cadherin 2, partial [Hyalella azteca]|uniref:Neural-cadherin 2 n=1 Tax=Hyalella azteca TaxID=294128 RepID=A0A979FJ27_HYAAZ